MPSKIINDLPLDIDGHQFWVSAVDYSDNESVIDMSSTGYIQLAPLVVPGLSNVTNIYTQRADQISAITPGEWNKVTPIYADVIAPVVVTNITSTDVFLSHMQVRIADDAQGEVNPYIQRAEILWNPSTGQWTSSPITFSCTYGQVYYFRARTVDSLGRFSQWSVSARETAGDVLAPGTIPSSSVNITSSGHFYNATIDLGVYTQADDHAYYEWWVNTSGSFPGGNGVREDDVEFIFTNKSGETVYLWVAAVDTSGNRSAGYVTSVGNAPFVSSDFWIETGNVTDISGDPIINVTDRGIEDQDGNTIFDFTSGTGVTVYNATLSGAINFGTGGALHLTDNAVAFAGTPIVGMEIIARGLKLYQDANTYFILEKDGASSINVEIVGGTFKTSGATSRIEMDSSAIRGYDAGNQRFNLDSDGSGWLGSFAAFNWDTDGNVNIGGSITATHIEAVSGTIAGWDISATEITVTPVATVTARLHSDGYIAFGSPAPTGYGNNVGAWIGEDSGVAKISLYTDANNFLQWDGATLSSTGINLSSATITASIFQTAASGARVVIDSSNGIQIFNSSPVQTVSLDVDGSGWFGVTGTRALEWTTAGVVKIADWLVQADSITHTFATDHSLIISTVTSQESIYFTDNTTGTGDVKWMGMGKLHNGTSWTGEEGFGLVVDVGATYEKYFWVSDVSAEIAGWTFTNVLLQKIFDTDKELNLEVTTGQESIHMYDPTPTTGDVRFVGMGTLHDGTGWTTETGLGVVVYNGSTYDKYLWVSDNEVSIAGWEFTEELFRSAASAERIELNATKNRISIFDAVNEKVVMGYLEGLGRNSAFGTATGGSTTYLDDTNQDWEDGQLIGLDIAITSGAGSGQTKTITGNTSTRISASFSPATGSGSVYAVRYTSSNFGFWALNGDQLYIDGDVTYEGGDWIVHNDASLRILDGSGNEILRLGTDTGEKGLFLYDTGASQLAKYVSDEIYIGSPGNYLQYTTAGGLVIEGSVTVTGTTYPAQPFDEDALLIWPLDSLPIDQSGNDNDYNSSYGANVTFVDGGVGGGYAATFPNGTGTGDYLRTTSSYSLQEMTITFWAKSSDTGANYVIAGASTFRFNAASNRPLVLLGSSNYRYFEDRSEQDDGAWHFWCIYIAGALQADINSAELWVDLEQCSVISTLATGAPSAFGVLQLGNSYNGSLQDFRVYNRELTESEKNALYINPMSRTSTRITGDKIRTGSIESNNWSSTLGSQINLSDGTVYLGGSSSPKLSWDGINLAIEGSITLTNTISASDISDVSPYAAGQDEQTLSELLADPTTPPGAGFYMSSANLGYYSGGAWTTYMDSSGNFYLGGTGGKLQWTSGVLTISGAITIESGSGIGNFSDAGPLVDATHLGQVPDGGGYVKATSNQATGGGYGYLGLNSAGTVVSSVIPTTTPTQQTGLNLTAQYLGYYNGGWQTFMDNTGNFYLGGTSGELQWDGNTLLLGGDSQLAFGTRLVHGANIMAPDIRLWVEDSTPSAGYGFFTGSSNPYGGDDNNAIVKKINPWGQQDFIWECTATVGDAEDGGWGYNSFSGDKDFRYRYSAWVKQTGNSDGGVYFGSLAINPAQVSNLTANGSDSGTTNPYFVSNYDIPNTTYFTTNAVTNGTMEATTSWTSYNSPVTNVRSATQAHSGVYSRQITVNDKNQGIYSAIFTTSASQEYTLRVWLYGDGNDWKIYVNDGTSKYKVRSFGYDTLTPQANVWTEYTLNFQANETSGTNRVYIVSGDTFSGTIYVDDVVVRTNLISNGSMEYDSGWASVGTPTTQSLSTVQKHAGTYSRRIIVNAANEGAKTSSIRVRTRTTTSTLANKLVDSTASFTTDGTAVGDILRNTTDDESTTVTGIDSASTLSVGANIFTVGEGYTVSSNASYIKLMGGYQYRAVIWLYGNGATTWQAEVNDGTSSYDFLETNNTTTLIPAASWTKYVLDFEALRTVETAYIKITSVGTSGTLYIDDVSLQETPWFLLVGFQHPDNHAGTESWGGIYHYKSGIKQAALAQDKKSMANTLLLGYRLFYYNSNTVTNQQYQYGPAIHVVDGSEPSIATMLGNAKDLGWSIENTTNINKYMVSSPTIRGGDFENGNYVQMDETGIQGWGSGVNTFNLDATTGSVSIKSSNSGQRIEIDGLENAVSFYDSSNTLRIIIDDDILPNDAGIHIIDGVVYCDSDTDNDYSYYRADGFKIYNYAGSFPNVIYYQMNNIYDNATNQNALDVWMKDSSTASAGFTGERIGIMARADITGSSLALDAIAIYGYVANFFSTGISMAGRFRCQDIAVRMEYDATDHVDFSVDSSGYLNITPSGDRLRLWESAKGTNDYTDMWTDTSGIFNLRPMGDRLRIWESVLGAGDYGDIYANTSGNLVLEAGGGGTVYVNDNFNVAGTYSRAGSVIVDASRNCDFNNVNADGAFQMDGATIITTTGQQTGNFKTRSYLHFGLNGVISAVAAMDGVGGVSRGEYIMPYDCIVTAVGVACNAPMVFLPGDQCIVEVEKATGLISGSFGNANVALVCTNASGHGNYYKYVTGQTTAFSAGDRMRIVLNLTGTDKEMTDPIVTVCILSE